MKQIKDLVNLQRSFFQTHQTKEYKFRVQMLMLLYTQIKKKEAMILEALSLDLGKSHFEGYLTEIGVIYLEIKNAMKHLKKWMKPIKTKTPLSLFKASSTRIPEPYGNVLIISPWNYPFQLTLSPLIGAISAGNTAILKVSPESKHISGVMKALISEIYDPAYVSVVEGDIPISQALLKERFDYIFFTGSTTVGKIVMQEASFHLTPVTLELGGKSPVLIDGSVSLDLCAKRIIYGKFINSGQTCIAPDYVLIPKHLLETWVMYAIIHIKTFYKDQPTLSDDYPKIINQKHYQRLIALLQDGDILYGGQFDNQKIGPTLMTNIHKDSLLRSEEIFGPILPIFTYETEDEAISFIQSLEKPLAFYPFSKNKAFLNRLINDISFGGATINDTLMHFANKHLPFGGVGYSGMGYYHGVHSFKTFTHYKSIVKRSTLVDLSLRYPPFHSKKLNFIKKIIK
jgi:aldehyde dehydrogenase (NAD+)